MLLVGILLFAIGAKAQITETKTFYEDGFTFQADVERTTDQLLRLGATNLSFG